MNNNKAGLWMCSIKMVLLGGAITAGALGFGQCDRGHEEGAAPPAGRAEVLRGIDGCLLVVHHHADDAAVDLGIDRLLEGFAAEPGPRAWSWICLAAPEFGQPTSFLSFHSGTATLAEFRGPWDREALRASVERMACDYRHSQPGPRSEPMGPGQVGGSPLVAERP